MSDAFYIEDGIVKTNVKGLDLIKRGLFSFFIIDYYVIENEIKTRQNIIHRAVSQEAIDKFMERVNIFYKLNIKINLPYDNKLYFIYNAQVTIHDKPFTGEDYVKIFYDFVGDDLIDKSVLDLYGSI